MLKPQDCVLEITGFLASNTCSQIVRQAEWNGKTYSMLKLQIFVKDSGVRLNMFVCERIVQFSETVLTLTLRM